MIPARHEHKLITVGSKTFDVVGMSSEQGKTNKRQFGPDLVERGEKVFPPVNISMAMPGNEHTHKYLQMSRYQL